jgi:hypothetical protein
MKAKPKVVKRDGVWCVHLPGYGFRPDTLVGRYPSQQAAMQDATSHPATAAGGSHERTYTPEQYWVGAWPVVIR